MAGGGAQEAEPGAAAGRLSGEPGVLEVRNLVTLVIPQGFMYVAFLLISSEFFRISYYYGPGLTALPSH